MINFLLQHHVFCYVGLAIGLATLYWIWDYCKKFGKN